MIPNYNRTYLYRDILSITDKIGEIAGTHLSLSERTKKLENLLRPIIKNSKIIKFKHLSRLAYDLYTAHERLEFKNELEPKTFCEEIIKNSFPKFLATLMNANSKKLSFRSSSCFPRIQRQVNKRIQLIKAKNFKNSKLKELEFVERKLDDVKQTIKEAENKKSQLEDQKVNIIKTLASAVLDE